MEGGSRVFYGGVIVIEHVLNAGFARIDEFAAYFGGV